MRVASLWARKNYIFDVKSIYSCIKSCHNSYSWSFPFFLPFAVTRLQVVFEDS